MRVSRQWIAGALAVFAVGMASGQTYYKWVDAHGTTHYSEQAPTTGSRPVNVTGQAMAPAPVASAVPAPASASSVLDEAKSAFRKQACNTARSNLALLSSRSMVLDTGTVASPAGLGEATKLSPEQRSAAKVAAQGQIHDYCDKQ